MTFCIATVVILIILAANIAVHGTGCWGLQAGGPLSASLYFIQVIVSVIAIFWSLHWLFSGQGKFRLGAFGIAVFLAFLAIFEYARAGWRMGTSIHNQGLENLPSFLLASSVALFVGCYKWRFSGRGKEVQEESK